MRSRYQKRPQHYDIMRGRVYGPVNKTMYLLECRIFILHSQWFNCTQDPYNTETMTEKTI